MAEGGRASRARESRELDSIAFLCVFSLVAVSLRPASSQRAALVYLRAAALRCQSRNKIYNTPNLGGALLGSPHTYAGTVTRLRPLVLVTRPSACR